MTMSDSDLARNSSPQTGGFVRSRAACSPGFDWPIGNIRKPPTFCAVNITSTWTPWHAIDLSMSHATRMRPQFIQRVYYLQRYGGPPLRTFSTIPPNTQPDIPHSTITDLASKPLHDLKLRDLARCLHSILSYTLANGNLTDMAALRSRRPPSSNPRTSPAQSYPHGSPTASTPSSPSLISSPQIHTSASSYAPTSKVSAHSSLTRARSLR